MIARLLAVLRSPFVRWGFVVAAVGLAAFAVYGAWGQIVEAVTSLSIGTVLAATGLSIVFVAFTFLSWRSLLADLGSRIELRWSVAMFGVSQLGKYLPGGVWNVVAAAEIGADHGIPRRRSATATAVATLLGVLTGGVVGVLSLPLFAAGALGQVTWVLWLLPLAALVLVPGVLNRLIATALRLARRDPPEHEISWRGLAAATAWALLGWVAIGAQVWVLGVDSGMSAAPRTFALAVGGYALAWVIGFLAVVAPAGVGVRELVLLVVLDGVLSHGAVLLVVILSRLLVTLADLLFAGLGAAVSRWGRGRG